MRRIFNSVRRMFNSVKRTVRSKSGMELVQVAILIAIAVALGIIFKSSITEFVNKIFGNLNAANF